MPRVIEKTVYGFDELSPGAQETARQWWRDGVTQDIDLDHVVDDAVAMGKLLGIRFKERVVPLMNGSCKGQPCVWWTGFWSQGDGACFEGRYEYRKASVRLIKENAPKDEELHRIAQLLYDVQRRHFYRLYATVEQRGHYYHAGCMNICVDQAGPIGEDRVTPDVAGEVAQCLRDFACWIYRQLQEEFEYHMADEQVDENIRANEYEFDDKGRRSV